MDVRGDCSWIHLQGMVAANQDWRGQTVVGSAFRDCTDWRLRAMEDLWLPDDFRPFRVQDDLESKANSKDWDSSGLGRFVETLGLRIILGMPWAGGNDEGYDVGFEARFRNRCLQYLHLPKIGQKVDEIPCEGVFVVDDQNHGKFTFGACRLLQEVLP